jgi:hypothetical protein
MEPKPTEAPTPETSVVEKVEKVEKPKKERSEAQKAATMKALAAMTAARKERAVKQKEHKEEVKVAKKVIEKKIVDENIKFATKSEIEAMRKELQDLRALHEAAKMVPQKEKPTERIVERVIERAPVPTAPAKLTGTALLDAIFFQK